MAYQHITRILVAQLCIGLLSFAIGVTVLCLHLTNLGNYVYKAYCEVFGDGLIYQTSPLYCGVMNSLLGGVAVFCIAKEKVEDHGPVIALVVISSSFGATSSVFQSLFSTLYSSERVDHLFSFHGVLFDTAAGLMIASCVLGTVETILCVSVVFVTCMCPGDLPFMGGALAGEMEALKQKQRLLEDEARRLQKIKKETMKREEEALRNELKIKEQALNKQLAAERNAFVRNQGQGGTKNDQGITEIIEETINRVFF